MIKLVETHIKWMPMRSVPDDRVILLGCESPGHYETFVAQVSRNPNGACWMVTVGWTGWNRLHEAWTPVCWALLPKIPSPWIGWDLSSDPDVAAVPPQRRDGI